MLSDDVRCCQMMSGSEGQMMSGSEGLRVSVLGGENLPPFAHMHNWPRNFEQLPFRHVAFDVCMPVSRPGR